jgi:predicted GIY-YIG superfamily endonuclease
MYQLLTQGIRADQRDHDWANRLHSPWGMPRPKCIVYVLRSLAVEERYYTGVTSDVEVRLVNHNAGRVPHTANGRPRVLDIAIQFADEVRAIRFERYLKSGSGCAFAKRHLR